MPQPKQLTLLENLAADQCDAQAIQLAQARHALNAAEEQLRQLRHYESGYRDRLGNQLERAMPIDALRDHHRFMQQVEAAARQQELEVARRRAHVDAIERLWQDAERRRQGFRVMAHRAAALDRLVDLRRQQKSNDEFAARTLRESNIGF